MTPKTPTTEGTGHLKFDEKLPHDVIELTKSIQSSAEANLPRPVPHNTDPADEAMRRTKLDENKPWSPPSFDSGQSDD